MEERIVVYTTTYCPYCQHAKRLLRDKNLPFKEVDVTGDSARRQWLVEATGRKTVPQLFIDGQAIGGFDDLARLEQSGKLKAMWMRVPTEAT